MEFEKPDLPDAENNELLNPKVEKKDKKKSRKKDRASLAIPKKAEKEKEAREKPAALPVDEIIADLLQTDGPDKKSKKEKPEAEETEYEDEATTEAVDQKTEEVQRYNADELIDVPLRETGFEAEIPLSLPSISEAETKANESAPESISPFEIFEEDAEELAAEKAGIKLPEPSIIEGWQSEAAAFTNDEQLAHQDELEAAIRSREQFSDLASRQSLAEDRAAAETRPPAHGFSGRTARHNTAPILTGPENFYNQWLMRRRVKKTANESIEHTKHLRTIEHGLDFIKKEQKRHPENASKAILTSSESPLLKERQKVAAVTAAEQFIKEKLPEEAEDIRRRLDLPPKHHMEHSAWHSIEVDETGHAVERPSISYGEEFWREKQQEALNLAPANEELAVASGQLAVGTTTTVGLLAQSAQAASSLASKSKALYNKLENTIPIASQLSSADAWLWLALTAVIAAIIIVAH